MPLLSLRRKSRDTDRRSMISDSPLPLTFEERDLVIVAILREFLITGTNLLKFVHAPKFLSTFCPHPLPLLELH